MLVHITSENKSEIDYIRNLAEISNDSKWIRCGAIVNGEGVLYFADIIVNPEIN